ncbi:MAG: hypothetical protein ACT4NL_06730 [Pseudomarimonas sp.]
MTNERRRGDEARSALKRQLNEDQRITLAEIERYGWELKFIRHPPFAPAVAVAQDSEKKKFVVIEPTGRINDQPTFKIRP